jgi:hypothetical protein
MGGGAGAPALTFTFTSTPALAAAITLKEHKPVAAANRTTLRILSPLEFPVFSSPLILFARAYRELLKVLIFRVFLRVLCELCERMLLRIC